MEPDAGPSSGALSRRRSLAVVLGVRASPRSGQMGWVFCSEHIPQRTVVCRHKPTRSHGVPRRSPRIDRACDNKDQQLPDVFRPLSSEAVHSPPLHS